MEKPRPEGSADFDAVCLGYNSIDHLCLLPNYPERGTKAPMTSYSVQGGGQAATACATLATLGFKARYLGKFGEGTSGKMAEDSLTRFGVDTSAALHLSGCPNQIAISWIDEQTGERTIINKRSRKLQIHPEELDRDSICSGRILVLDAHDYPAMIQAAKWAKEDGIPVVLDIEKPKPGVEQLLDRVNYIITNEQFPSAYTGIKNMEKALKQLSRPGNFVAATLGAKGSLALVDGKFIHTHATDIEVVDSTGAGDVFHGAFAAGLLLGYDIVKTLRFANIAAGLKCRHIGGRAGIPKLDEVLSFLE